MPVILSKRTRSKRPAANTTPVTGPSVGEKRQARVPPQNKAQKENRRPQAQRKARVIDSSDDDDDDDDVDYEIDACPPARRVHLPACLPACLND